MFGLLLIFPFRDAGGGWLRALFHRGTLRELSKKIEKGTITPEEVRQYVDAGGSLDRLKSYDALRDFEAGSADVPLLNYFVAADPRRPPQAGRIESLEILLSAGADPNRTYAKGVLASRGAIAPTLLAVASDDREALERFLKHRGNLELVHPGYLCDYGPALALAESAEMGEFLLSRGANLSYVDGDGNTLLHKVVRRPAPIAVRRTQAAWLLSKKVPAAAVNRDGQTALDLVRQEIAIVTSRGMHDVAKELEGLAALFTARSSGPALPSSRRF
jgi:hypothetical protein